MDTITTRASGRLCLLGEHADYLGLEVISCPLDQHLHIEGRPRESGPWRIELADLGTERLLDPSGEVSLSGPNDYLAAGLLRLSAQGRRFPTAYDVRVHSTIPIGKGVSSSSALCVAWMDFLNRASDAPRRLGPAELAEEAYGLEVLDFGQPGGMQDHYTIAFGTLVHLDCRRPVLAMPLPARLTGFVLGDSGSTKDTQGVLSRIRGTVERALGKLGWGGESLRSASAAEVERAAGALETDESDILLATVLNRDQTRLGAALLRSAVEDVPAQRELGRLLSEHHEHLKRRLRTSTPTIDAALEIAQDAGALGGKVVGSGGGGCFLAYAPDRADAVVAALTDKGIEARVVH
jgi:galactokinase